MKRKDIRKLKVRTPKPKIKTFVHIHTDKKNDYRRKPKHPEGKNLDWGWSGISEESMVGSQLGFTHPPCGFTHRRPGTKPSGNIK